MPISEIIRIVYKADIAYAYDRGIRGYPADIGFLAPTNQDAKPYPARLTGRLSKMESAAFEQALMLWNNIRHGGRIETGALTF